MDSAAQARAHIQRLRDGLPEGHPNFDHLVAKALDILVNQLYNRSTHFVMEFIQNLDDTKYADSVSPTVKFTYKPGRLRIDSNQIGFSAQDVDAICSIGSSTKTEPGDRATNSIGEKGIGFKSVFRLARRVWLSSRSYSIRWDRAARFGALVPEWATFPEPVASGHTAFILDLEHEVHEDQIMEELGTFDPAVMLFLNRLTHIDIELHDTDGHVRAKSFSLKTAVETRSQPGPKVVTDGDTDIQYLETHFCVEDLPEDLRRQGGCSSELVFAFPPIDNSDISPPSISPYVYSGLPIDRQGLKFLVNADFILTASRQSIDVSTPRNIALRDAMSTALVEAVHQITNIPRMRYTWPWFITSPDPSSLFASTMSKVRQILASERIMESHDGQSRIPTALTYANPAKFGVNGQVVTLSPLTEDRYLSAKYPSWTVDAILTLGVKQLTNADFLDDLGSMISSDPVSFQQKPSTWHEELAGMLLPLVDDANLEKLIEKMCIIPLLDGDWVSAASRKNQAGYWPEDLEPGIIGQRAFELGVIQHDAARQHARRKLFDRLGMKTLGPRRICPVIMKMHAETGPKSLANSDVLSDHELISQALYLHQCSYNLGRLDHTELWVVTSDGGRCQGRKTYIHNGSTVMSPASRISAVLCKEFPMLHDRYHVPRIQSQTLQPEVNDHIDGPNSSETLTDYLARTFGISESTKPRLVLQGPEDSCDVTLSDEFRYLFKTCSTSDVLQVILQAWSDYSKWLQNDGLPGHESECYTCIKSREEILMVIHSKVVQGLDQDGSPPISIPDLVLPNLDPFIQSDTTLLPTLDIPESQNPTVRHRLQCLGVTTNRDASFYMKCLRALRRHGQPKEEAVAYVYEQLQAFYEDDKDIIESGFLKDDLVFLTPSSLRTGRAFGGWTSLVRCSRSISLENEYPRSARLFRQLQAADGLGVDELIKRLLFLTGTSSCISDPSGIIQVLCQISTAISAMTERGAAHTVMDLRTKSVFPVTSESQKTNTCILRSCIDDDWYIADRLHLYESFLGTVALLCVPVAELEKLAHLIRALGLTMKKLSSEHLVTTTTFPKGPIKLRVAETEMLRSRVPFIELLSPDTEFIATTLSQLRTATVSKAADIIESHTLRGKKSISGRDVSSQAVSQVEGGQLRLFVSARSSSSNVLTHLTEPLLELCEIGSNPVHICLFHILLSETNDASVGFAFAKRGLHLRSQRDQVRSRPPIDQVSPWYSSDAMDFAIPSGSVTWDGDTSSSDESTGEDLLQNFYRPKKSRCGERSLVGKQDRRLNLMTRRKVQNPVDGSEGQSRITALNENLDIMFLGETLASKFFQKQLGAFYNPLTSWTSPLRSRAGLDDFPADDNQTSFTMAESNVATRMTRFLHNRGWEIVGSKGFVKEVPVYHFDVTVSIGGLEDTFQYGTSHMRRAQIYRPGPSILQSQHESPKPHLLVLIRITNVYEEPQFHFLLDPWRHLVTGRIQLQPGLILTASLGTKQRPCVPNGGPISTQIPHREAEPGTAIQSDSKRSLNTGRPEEQDTPSATSDLPGGSRCLPDVSLTSDDPSGSKRSPDLGREASSGLNTRTPFACASNTEITPVYPDHPYEHLRDDQIRLFTLFPGDVNSDLKGIIWTTTFEAAGNYTSLSYVWGSSNQAMHPLTTPLGILSITTSLRTALVRLRRPQEPLTLWVDAICINQTDNEEKSRQVMLLAQIFQRSARTVAFIDGEDRFLALQMLMQVEAGRILGPTSEAWPPDLPRCPAEWAERGMPCSQDPIWKDVAAFFHHAWFRRSWIIQEAVIARKLEITHGDYHIDWDRLFSVMTHIDQNLERSGHIDLPSWTPFLKLGSLRRMERRQSRSSLLKLLENFRYVQSTDPRDRFFSLLGIASDGHLEDFEPDYSSPFPQVARRFANTLFRRFASQKQAMLLLYSADLASQSVDLPSWMPNWLIQKPNGLHETLQRGTEFDASKGVEEDIEHVPGTDELAVATTLVAKIDIVSKSANDSGLVAQQQFFAEIESLLEDCFVDIWTPEQREKVLYEAPIAGAIHPKFAESGDLSVQDSWKAYRKILQNPPPSSLDKEAETLKQQSRVYESLLGDEVRGWRFIILERCVAGDLCGIAPDCVQEGDLVRILHGGRVPFITREREDNPGTERLVGQCFILGIMQGQMFEDKRAVDLETIRLS